MKKMLLATALTPAITGCAQQTFTVQNKPAAVAPKETITHHFFVSELGRRKLSMHVKFVAAQKMLKEISPANIRKWIARFYYFRVFIPAGSACVFAHTLHELPIDMGNSSALLINILWFLPVVFA